MNILTYSSLYPNAVDPSHGVFIEHRLRRLRDAADVSASVVAPVPWFPFRSRLWGQYGEFARIPGHDIRAGISVSYPRFPIIPKIGMLLAPAAMALATEQCVTSAADKLGGADLIDAHYFYPDGVAASKIARRLGLPFIVTGRGTDINLIAQMPGPRKMILAAARAAAAVVAVSRALANEMQSIGIDEKKIHVLRNGVDLAAFQPGDRAKARRTLGFDTVTFVSVGVLREAKGHNVAIEALLHIENSRLVIIGGGEYESQLRALVKRHRLGDRVTFTGRIDQAELCSYYQAADALLLLSRREGMPNVVLESLACGTPVIAANVGGLAEVVTGQDMGRLLGECAARAVADAWSSLLQHGVDRDRIRKAAERFSWDETVADLYRLMTRCAHKGRH